MHLAFYFDPIRFLLFCKQCMVNAILIRSKPLLYSFGARTNRKMALFTDNVCVRLN